MELLSGSCIALDRDILFAYFARTLDERGSCTERLKDDDRHLDALLELGQRDLREICRRIRRAFEIEERLVDADTDLDIEVFVAHWYELAS